MHGIHFTKSFGEQKKPTKQDKRKADYSGEQSKEAKFDRCKRLGLCYECESKDHRAQDCAIKAARLERDNSKKRKGKARPSMPATASSSNALAAEEESEHDSLAQSCWNLSVTENDYLAEPSRQKLTKKERFVIHNYFEPWYDPREEDMSFLDRRVFICQECYRAVASEEALARHMDTCHLGTEDEPSDNFIMGVDHQESNHNMPALVEIDPEHWSEEKEDPWTL